MLNKFIFGHILRYFSSIKISEINYYEMANKPVFKKREIKSNRALIVQKNPIKKILVKINSFKLILLI